MKKLMIPIVFGLIFCIQPVDLFAKTICFASDGSVLGAYLVLSGGKVDEKPFAGNWVFGSKTVPTWGAVIKDASGNIQLSFCNPHHPSTFPPNFCGSLSGPSTLSLSGQIDFQSNGTFDGPVTLTEVNCNTIPTARPEIEPVPGTMGFPEQSANN
jgi:hypothetical protein